MRPVGEHILIKIEETKIKVADKELYVDHTYNPQSWVPSYGKVVSSDVDFVKEGDIAYVDYFSVLMALGRKYDRGQRLPNPLWIEEDGKTLVFVKPSSVFFVIRDGNIVLVNDYTIIEPIYEKKSELAIKEEMTKFCYVIEGEHKGKKVVFNKNRIRNCGSYGFDSKEYIVTKEDNILAEVEE